MTVKHEQITEITGVILDLLADLGLPGAKPDRLGVLRLVEIVYNEYG